MMTWIPRVAIAGLLTVVAAPTLAPAQGEKPETAKELEKRAKECIAAKKYDEAYSALKRAVTLAGADRETRYQLALACTLTGRGNDALDILDELDSVEHEDMRIPELFIRIFEQRIQDVQSGGGGGMKTVLRCKGDIRDYLIRIVKHRPKDLQSLRKLLATCMELNDTENCLRWGSWSRSHFPKLADGYVTLGHVSLQSFFDARDQEDEARAKRFLDEALKTFREGAAASPEDAAPLERIAFCLEWSGSKDEAAKTYGEALARYPASADISALMKRFSAAQMLTMLQIAVKGFDARHGSEKRKDDALMRYYLGWYLEYSAKKHADAYEQLARAVAKDSSYTACYYHMGVAAAWGMEDYGKAAEAFAALGELGPEKFAAIVRSNGGKAKIIADMLAFLISFMNGKGNFDLCRGLAAGKVGLDPTNGDDWNNYALFARDTHKYSESLEAYRRALAIEPDNPQYMNDLAVILHFYLYVPDAKTSLEQAIKYYRKAIKLAESRLRDQNLDADKRDSFKTALRDARNNLRKAERGDRRAY